MGEVWTGRDTKLEREVAVKFIRFPEGQPDQELTRRFVRESRITARLEHPGVPPIYDVGTHDGRPYMVMQRIRGVSVADLVAEHGPLPIGWAAAIAAQVCAVLAVAHDASLIHRDLKPSNLMLDPHGCVKVLDFGLAVARDRADISQITITGQTLGTPAYMAPEQVLAGLSGPATDLYALGCTLHEMLTGSAPFTGATAYSVMRKQVDEPPPPATTVRHDIPGELAQLLLALLDKAPEQRPADATAVYERLLPYAVALDNLPAVLHPPTIPSAVRMYARVVTRVHATQPTPTAEPTTVTAPAAASPALTRQDLAQTRHEATRLSTDSRYQQAADVLAAVVEPATEVFGARDDEVASLRLQWADALYDAGDYRRAAPLYRCATDDLAARHGPHASPVFHTRLKEVNCYALIGQTSLALRRLDTLLREARQARGEGDPTVLELRKQSGLLQLGAGRKQDAERTLARLRADLARLHGPDHPAVAEVGQLLSAVAAGPANS